jgi:hypothetical protein
MATTYYVDAAAGNDSNNGLSAGAAKATIGAAVSASSGTTYAAYDTIYVKNSGNYNEKVAWGGKHLMLIGYGSSLTDEGVAVIDGQSTRDNGIEVDNNGASTASVGVRNFEVKNCTSHGVELTNTSGGSANVFNFFDNVYSHHHGGWGFIDNWAANASHFWSRCDGSFNTSGGFHLVATESRLAALCRAKGNGGPGFKGVGVCTICESLDNSIPFDGVRHLILCSGDDGNTGAIWVTPTLRSCLAVLSGFTNGTTYGIDNGTGTLVPELTLIHCGLSGGTLIRTTGPAWNSNPVTANPLYQDQPNGDLRLLAGSPWLSRQVPIGRGNPALLDIGAWQGLLSGGVSRARVMGGL